MIKAIIADDETRICQLIIALGEWERLGVEVAGVAQNGIEALELVKSVSAEMLITDIRMPGLSGLELIGQVRQHAPNLKIIIISGYANFEYAQQALKEGVNDYLLKPINRRALNEAIERLADIIRSERQSHAAMDASMAQMETIHRERSALISDLLSMNPPRADRALLREKYHLDCRAGVFQTLALKMDIPLSMDDGAVFNGVREKVRTWLEEILQQYCADAVCLPQNSILYALYCCKEDVLKPLRDALRELLKRMAAWNNLYGNVGFSIALGPRCDDPRELPESLVAARLRVAERLIDGTGRLLEQDVSGQAPSLKPLSDECFRQLNRAIDESDAAGAAQTLSRLRQSLGAMPGIHGWEVQELVLEAGNMLIARMDPQNPLYDRLKLTPERLAGIASERAATGERDPAGAAGLRVHPPALRRADHAGGGQRTGGAQPGIPEHAVQKGDGRGLCPLPHGGAHRSGPGTASGDPCPGGRDLRQGGLQRPEALYPHL